MQELELTYACEDYDLQHAIIDGSVQPEGVRIVPKLVNSFERHDRMTRESAYDLAEFSMNVYVAGALAGLPLVALPVFPRRMFIHRYIFVNAQRSIAGPEDLAGRRIGIARHQNTLSLVARGMLHDQYGLDLSSVTWVTQREETWQGVDIPESFTFEAAPNGVPLESLLISGQIDAMMIPETISAWDRGNPKVRRLFPDFKMAEQDYYRTTHIFPVMHVVVVRRELLEREPWLADSLVEAFGRAQDEAFSRIGKPARVSLAWARSLLEEERTFFGSSPWPIGVKDNELAINAMSRWSHLLGLTHRIPTLSELFPYSTVD